MFGTDTRHTIYWVTAMPTPELVNLEFPIKDLQTDLPQAIHDKLYQLIASNADLFLYNQTLPQTNAIKCDIRVTTSEPIVAKRYIYNDE